MPWIVNHKHKIEEKSTKSSRSSFKVVDLGPADLWEFPTLITSDSRIWFQMASRATLPVVVRNQQLNQGTCWWHLYHDYSVMYYAQKHQIQRWLIPRNTDCHRCKYLRNSGKISYVHGNSNIPASKSRLWGTRWYYLFSAPVYMLRCGVFGNFSTKDFNRTIKNCMRPQALFFKGLHLHMYNLNDFVCCIPQMKREYQAIFLQLTTFPTNINVQHFLSWGINFKTNHWLLYLQWIWIFGMSNVLLNAISMGPHQPTVSSVL